MPICLSVCLSVCISPCLLLMQVRNKCAAMLPYQLPYQRKASIAPVMKGVSDDDLSHRRSETEGWEFQRQTSWSVGCLSAEASVGSVERLQPKPSHQIHRRSVSPPVDQISNTCSGVTARCQLKCLDTVMHT